MKLQQINVNDLHVSPLNQRAKDNPNIDDILPSIRRFGVLQTLAVHKNGQGHGVIAGSRRLKAAQAVAKETGEPVMAPCAVLDVTDEADMRTISLVENMARKDPDPMTEFETFAALIKDGREVADVAALFGVSERAVRQRLALGGLKPAIRKLYREEAIDHGTAKYLTMASTRQQAEWLRLWKAEDEHAPTGWQLRTWLFDGRGISVRAAIFDLDAFKGRIVTDLFGDEAYFADSNEFWKHQNEGIAACVEAHEQAGWSEVVLLETGRQFYRWEHAEKPKQDGGRVYIQVDYDGSVNIHAGYVTKAEARRAGKIARGETSGERLEPKDQPAVRPELTKAAETYVNLHRHNAVRAAVANNPKMALRLVLAHAMGGAGLWSVRADTRGILRTRDDAYRESVGQSKDARAFENKRRKALKTLDLEDGDVADAASYGEETRAAQILARLLKLSDAKVMDILAVVMAETLQSGSGMAEVAGELLEVDMSETYAPDDVFFSLIKDRKAIGAMLGEVAGRTVADGNLTATGKVKKAIIRDCLNGTNGRAKVKAWTPGYFEFPFRAHDRADGLDAPAKRARLAHIFPQD